MRRILRHWRRLLLAVFLLGLGYVLYQRLPPVERILAEHGYEATSDRSFQWGLIRSAVWRRGPATIPPFKVP